MLSWVQPVYFVKSLLCQNIEVAFIYSGSRGAGHIQKVFAELFPKSDPQGHDFRFLIDDFRKIAWQIKSKIQILKS